MIAILFESEGYDLVCAEHPNNIKRGGVYIYYKESSPLRVITLLYLNQAFFLEVANNNNNKIIVSVIYLSPSQNNNEFELFLSSFRQLLNDVNKSKTSLYVTTGNFNARSSLHCVKSVQIRSYFWTVFGHFSRSPMVG